MVGLAAVFLLGMAGATVFSIRQARIAQRETGRAQAANQFLTTVFRIPFSDPASHHDMTVRELLELAEKRVTPALGRDPAIATDVDFVLGGGLVAQQARDEARALFQRALVRARQAGDIPRQSIALSWLAFESYQTGNNTLAWTQALESLRLWQSFSRNFTAQQAVLVLTQSGQLMEYIRPADLIHREYLQEAVRLARRDFQKVEIPLRAQSLQALAESYLGAPGRGEGAYRAAYPLIQEALSLSRSDPSLDTALVDSLRSWGRVNRFLGHNDQDEAAQHEVYDLLRRHLGPDHIEAASQRAIWAFSLTGIGRIDEAYQQSQQALATMRQHFQKLGSPQLWTNTAVAAYADCLTGRFKECEALAREALQTLEPNPQPTDPRVFEARSYLGLALRGQGRFPEALPLLQQTVEFYHSRNRQGPFMTALESAYAQARQSLNPPRWPRP
jgi:tetratricopeptide (TPR) repeat protein